MSTGLRPGQSYPTTTYGAATTVNNPPAGIKPAVESEMRPSDPPGIPYGTPNTNLSYVQVTEGPFVSRQKYPPTPYGTNADKTGPTVALRTPLLKGAPYPQPVYEPSGDTGTPGNFRKALISGDPYPTTPYGAGAQTTNSQPTDVVAVFQVNLQTLNYWDWDQPNREYLEGNEVTTEAQNQIIGRSTWLPSLFNGVENLVLYNQNAGTPPTYGADSFPNNPTYGQFTAYGAKAVYLYNTYCKAGDPNAVLTLVSSTGLLRGPQQ